MLEHYAGETARCSVAQRARKDLSEMLTGDGRNQAGNPHLTGPQMILLDKRSLINTRLEQCFSNLNVHMKSLGHLVKM